MLTKIQINEIREHLERAQNPIFYYDNDCDGLCSFLLLRRFIGRGNGVSIRSYPELNKDYARKAKELDADYVFVLDKPKISREFVEEINSLGIPFVWIDHHEIQVEDFRKEFDNFFIYNPTLNFGKDKSDEPVSYLSYRICNKKEDVWIAVMGCISDNYLPDFWSEFSERFSEYSGKVKGAFDVYYKTEIGNLARALNFGLKDSITNVVKLQKFLFLCSNPGEVLSESLGNKNFLRKFKEIRKKYDSLLEKAHKNISERLIFFIYAGESSISSDIANALMYEFPDKYVIVLYKKGAVANVSIRGKNVRNILEKVLEKMEHASGGGHKDAVGARIRAEDIEKFRELFEEEIR